MDYIKLLEKLNSNKYVDIKKDYPTTYDSLREIKANQISDMLKQQYNIDVEFVLKPNIVDFQFFYSIPFVDVTLFKYNVEEAAEYIINQIEKMTFKRIKTIFEDKKSELNARMDSAKFYKSYIDITVSNKHVQKVITIDIENFKHTDVYIIERLKNIVNYTISLIQVQKDYEETFTQEIKIDKLKNRARFTTVYNDVNIIFTRKYEDIKDFKWLRDQVLNVFDYYTGKKCIKLCEKIRDNVGVIYNITVSYKRDHSDKYDFCFYNKNNKICLSMSFAQLLREAEYGDVIKDKLDEAFALKNNLTATVVNFILKTTIHNVTDFYVDDNYFHIVTRDKTYDYERNYTQVTFT